MITAAAPTFPRLRPSVTSVSVSTTRCLRDDSCELRLRSQDHDLQLPYQIRVPFSRDIGITLNQRLSRPGLPL
jgi:hypothetical protein